MAEDSEFRVWVGCLACYNEGRLLGTWVDARDAGDVSTESLHSNTPTVQWAPHEELWCFDIENAPQGHRGEMSPMEAQRLAEVLDSIDDEDQREAFAAWCAHTGEEFSEDSIAAFRDDYHGKWDSFRDYADEYADDTIIGVAKAQLGLDDDNALIRHFDWQDFSDELEQDHWTEDASGGGVHVFSNS